ncbi:hypothetical protein Cni_G08871 [Canna indica]|uniref:Transcription repressor n=1 Tax=Canna indica TaxID=4628 RepID=A0AAQ3K3M6_9LILI|nr:hypothetical protein Cni_G08871 [Canna indica]
MKPPISCAVLSTVTISHVTTTHMILQSAPPQLMMSTTRYQLFRTFGRTPNRYKDAPSVMCVREEIKAMPCVVDREKRRKAGRCSSMSLSFSASLPGDVAHGALKESICAVKYTVDPLADFRRSIVEMIREGGVRDWEEMEELVYCYVVLNASEVHCFVAEAFLSLC